MKQDEVIQLLKEAKVQQALAKSDEVEDKESMAEKLADFASTLGKLKGHPDLCVAILLKSLDLDPDNPEICLALGNALSMPLSLEEDSDNALKAIDWYELALKLDPDYSDARYNKSLLLFFMGRMDEAKDEYQKLAEGEPQHPGVEILGDLIQEYDEVEKDASS